MMQEVHFKHWKTGEILVRRGEPMKTMNPKSDLILLKLENGKYEDIRKETIVEVRNVG